MHLPARIALWTIALWLLVAGGSAQTPGAATRALGRVTIEPGIGDFTEPTLLYAESHALLIGVSAYTAGWPRLPGVRRDVAQVAGALEGHGFVVQTVLDPTAAALRTAITDFINGPGSAMDARLLIYFAGHGHTRELGYGGRMGYIVPADAPHPDRDLAGFRRMAIDMQQFETWARRIESKHALFVFDSCFSGEIFALSRAVPVAVSLRATQPIRQFISSGSADQEVPDESDFAREFVRALGGEADANRDGFVTGSELGEFLYDRVTNYSRGAQTPQYGKIRHPHLDRGDFIFQLARSAAAPAGPPPPVPEFSADDLLTAAQRRQQQQELATAARTAYDTMRQIDANEYVEAKDKAAKWQEYLDKFSAADHELAYARERERHWREWRPTPTPAPTPATPNAGDKQTLDLGSGVSMTLVWIPPGTFTMGSPSNESSRDSDEGPQTRVTLTRGFWMGETEVTQAQWKAVMGSGNNPSHFKGDTLPVEMVSWNDAMDFCRRLSERSGRTVTLPTEAQWEYACRAGTTTRFSFGDSDSSLGNYAWFTSNSGSQTRPVRGKQPNAWGLYDMHGNVWEWCLDWFGAYPGGSVTDPTGASSGSYRVLRGGSWGYTARYCRSASRGGDGPTGRFHNNGFRVVLAVQ
jgi:formylglycine-generating enzyme required for sulfatase activity